MTNPDEGDRPPDSGDSPDAPVQEADAESSATGRQRSAAGFPSRRGFLQASGLAIGMTALGEARARGDNRTTEHRHQTMTQSDSQESSLRTTRQVSLEMGKQILDAMEQKAREIDVPSVLAVTDAEGNLVAHRRMDNAWLPSVNIARNKAYTAAGFEFPTHELAEVTTPGESLWGLHVTDESRIVVFGGGFPLTADGSVVGAVGASGGQVSEDREVASAGVEKFEELVG